VKKITSASCLLVSLAMFGCAQHATAPAVARPDSTASSDTNTFGDSKSEAAGDAAHARESYGAAPSTEQQANSGTAAPKK
jgi:hypothetical protein